MSEFKINVKPLRKEKENLDSIKKTIQTNRDQVDSIANNLSLSNEELEQIRRALREISKILTAICKSTSQFGSQLSSILDLYEKTENNITNTTINNSNPQTTTGSGNATGDNSSNNEDDDKISTSGGGRRRHGGGSSNDTFPTFINNYDYEYSQYNISVPVCPEFLSRDVCLLMAEKIIEDNGENGMCNDMDALRIAKELYFHAVLYYGTGGPGLEWLEDLLGENSDILLSKHADPADIGLGDDLDSYYDLFWTIDPAKPLPPSIILPAFPFL